MNILSYVHLRNIYRSTGVGRVSRELTEHLARLPDVNVEVLADREDHRQIISKVGQPWTSFQYHFFKHETSRQQALWFLLDRPRAEDYWRAADVVHCTAESYVPVRKARLAVSCHDTQHFEPGAHKMSMWLLKQRFKWKLLFDRLAREADMFHMISEFAAERTAHFFPRIASRLRVIPNAASESFFHPATEKGMRILAELGVEHRPYLLVPGGLHHRKNAELILEAWPAIHGRVPDLALVIINHLIRLTSIGRRLWGLRLVLAGFQEEDTLVALYRAAQLVWFPTRYDGFGMPVIEAMACGTPVVSSDTSAIPEVTGGAAVLLDPEPAGPARRSNYGAIKDGAALADLSRRGRSRAEHFRWANSARMLAREFAALK